MAASRPAQERPDGGFTIRRARYSDAPAIARAHRAAIRGISDRIYSQRQKNSWLKGVTAANELKGMRWRGRRTFVATMGLRVVGYSAIVLNNIIAVYVRASHSQKGMGRRLLRSIEMVAKRKRGRYMELYSSVNAVPFYRKRGYRLVKWTHHTFRADQVSIRCAVMRKRLPSKGK